METGKRITWTPKGEIKGNKRIRIYDSVEALTAAADQAWESGRQHPRDWDSETRFVGRSFSDWKAAKAAAGQTWEEGIRMLEDLMQEIEQFDLPTPKSRRRKAEWNEDGGDDLDLDRLRAGQAYWRRIEPRETTGTPTIAIISDLSTSCNKKARDILWRGLVSLILANRLEEAGYRVELWAVNNVSHGYRDNTASMTAVQLKRADQPLDMATLINALSGWFFRTVVFQEYYTQPAIPCGSLGTPSYLLPADLKEIAGNATTIEVSQIWDRTAALAKIRKELAAYCGAAQQQ